MEPINASDKVQIVKVNAGQEKLLNKIGRVMLITDDVNCVVSFPDGSGASVHVSQLKRLP